MFRLNSKNGKIRLVTIVLIIILLIVIEGIVIVHNKKNKSDIKDETTKKQNNVADNSENDSPNNSNPESIHVKSQILRRYNFEDLDDELAEEFEITEDIIINLSKNDEYKQYGISASDITILEITEDYVKISREAIRYDENGNQYTEEMVEDVEYDKAFELLISSTEPNSTSFSAARYSYYMKFVKI